MITYQELIALSHASDVNKKDVWYIFKDLDYLSSGGIKDGADKYLMTEHAFKQFWHRLKDSTENKKLVVFSNSVIRHFWEEPEIGNYAFYHHIELERQNNPERLEKPFLFRLNDSDCRAVLSDQYGSILNSELLEALQTTLLQLSPTFRIVRYELDFDSLTLYTLHKELNVEDGEYGLGLYIYNDEIGRHSLKVATVIKRRACDNSCILTNVKTLYHRNRIVDRLNAILPDVSESLRSAEKYITNMHLLRGVKVEFTKEIEELTKRFQLSEEETYRIHMGSENDTSMWGLVNGINYAAKYVRPDLREQFEVIAGNLVMKALYNLV